MSMDIKFPAQFYSNESFEIDRKILINCLKGKKQVRNKIGQQSLGEKQTPQVVFL